MDFLKKRKFMRPKLAEKQEYGRIMTEVKEEIIREQADVRPDYTYYVYSYDTDDALEN